ncbi:MAG: hypothetical protein QF723_00860 [Phycisphaerales bacterium]|jgi:hypothetical protein|nr:hypothetical protein [Planctomycetaceae bacterium]MDP6158992.1 hypothetical protein [Phycisphaerales bacterium]MDP6312379.1 hypothetical protein [Phycisphaerales bacterium]MDP7087719.1 hypothetical protein [Phycisphaerales bacterium]MDP7189711.1 hypothetical protein [Phycisphaerales bacterium]|tara:strand:- start:1795 stop:3000 length:1206 start_codon:yes stop_codon:yes gene_type:complete
MKPIAALVASGLIAAILGCQSPAARVPISEQHEAVIDGGLVVFHPPGESWQLIAESTLELLQAGRATAVEDFGMEPPDMGVLLMEGGGGTWLFGTSWPHPETEKMIVIFPMPVASAAVLAEDIRAGGTILGGETESLAGARHVGLFLEVHEMWHLLQQRQAAIQFAGIWLDEGLAEYLAYRTALREAPDAVAGFIEERLRKLDDLPDDGVLDLLAWSVGDGEMMRQMMLNDGEVVTLGWKDARRLREVRRAIEQGQGVLDRLAPKQRAKLASDIRLWQEIVDIGETKTGLPLIARDHNTRWGIYGILLALFLELDDAGFDPAALTKALCSPEYSRKDHWQRFRGGVIQDDSRTLLTATNGEIMFLLPDIGGLPAAELIRAYPVARAKQVLRSHGQGPPPGQ